MGFKKRGAREVVWGPEEPWVEPKKEVVLGPAADLSGSSTSGESALGFLGAMASANSSDSSESSSSTKSPYGWEPSESSSTSTSLASDPDMTDKIFRLQRKIDSLVERIEALERKMNN